MSAFQDKYAKYLNTLEDPKLTVAQQLIATAGQGGNKQNYHKPTDKVVQDTLKLLDALFGFDLNPSDITFSNVQNALARLEMKAVRVEDSPEWIYITPDADPKKEKAKWERISINTQFDLSWHVGSNSKVGASDEHNGGDGAFRVVGEMVAEADNMKLIMSNSRKRNTSKKLSNGRFYGDWAHSSATIDYPVMRYLAQRGFAIINVHGMASRQYGLLVNNRTSNFTKDTASLPTMLGIAIAQYFHDSNNKKFTFGGVIPGSMTIAGVRKPLSPLNNQKSSPNSLFYRAKGVHNTNVIGNLIHNVNANINHVKPYKYDSGKSCHIEFGIVRDGRGDLRKLIAALNLAAYWMNNYKDELNPWQVVKKNPNFDMAHYGDLFPPNPALEKQLDAVAMNDNPIVAADVAKPQEDLDDIDVDPIYLDFDPNEADDEDVNEDSNITNQKEYIAKTLLLSAKHQVKPNKFETVSRRIKVK